MEEEEEEQGGPIRSPELSDVLVLAAVRRAALHRAPAAARGWRAGRASEAAPLHEIRAHIGIAPRSAAAAALRERLAQLEQRGLLAQAREHGVSVWSLRASAARLLASVRARGEEPRLGESPQHAAWRRARRLAQVELGRLAADLRDTVERCEQMLTSLQGPPARTPASDEWFALAERLRSECRRLGSAQHCLREWQEPDDEQADVDDLQDAGDERYGRQLAAVQALRAGRRNTRLWAERD